MPDHNMLARMQERRLQELREEERAFRRTGLIFTAAVLAWTVITATIAYGIGYAVGAM